MVDELDEHLVEALKVSNAWYDSVLKYDQSPLDIQDFIRGELLLAFDFEMVSEADGPHIYGEGNFDVVLIPFKTWHAVPKAGWEPTELEGILSNADSINSGHASPGDVQER